MEKASRTKTKNNTNNKSNSKSKTPPIIDDKLVAIRDLLFGEQVTEINDQISRSVAQLERRITTLEKNCDKQFDNISKNLAQLKSDLLEQLDKSDCEHQSSEAIIEQNIAELEKAHSTLEGHSEQNFEDLRLSLKKQSKTLNEKLETEINKLLDFVEQRTAELGDNKADRKTLAALLESVASNLTENQT